MGNETKGGELILVCRTACEDYRGRCEAIENGLDEQIRGKLLLYYSFHLFLFSFS